MQAQNANMKSKVLIVATRRWFSAARLAMAFAASGCRVEIVCPSNHPAMLTRRIAARYSFQALRPVRSLHSAISRSLPDLIVPTDDMSVSYLHQLYRQAFAIDEGTSSFIQALLQRSLGNPDNFAILTSRTDFLAVAQSAGVSAMPTEKLPDERALHQWLAANPLPAVLKADGTSGGEGVKIVRTKKQAVKAWRTLHAPLDLMRAVKKFSVEGDPHHIVPWIMRHERTVSIQKYIYGHDSNIAVAAWKGELLGAVSIDVLRTWRPKGPAALIELAQDDQMLNAARILVRELNLSGLCGFDFVTEDATGKVHLIEINPRATPTCHLPHGVPRDLIPSLVSVLGNQPLPNQKISRKRHIIALFPLAWKSGISRELLASAHHDIPWEEPRLAWAGFAGRDKSFYETCREMWGRIHASQTLAGERVNETAHFASDR